MQYRCAIVRPTRLTSGIPDRVYLHAGDLPPDLPPDNLRRYAVGRMTRPSTLCPRHGHLLVLPVLLLVLLPGLSGCSGKGTAPPAVAAAPQNPGDGESPAERCLAIAGAKRERKADEPAKITVRHILVKYAGSKRAAPEVTRTREEACLRALEARTKLEQGAPFAEVVASYSEEPGAATREGSIGAIERADVAAPFADAAFELGRGDVSHVVETDFGFHVIMRTQ